MAWNAGRSHAVFHAVLKERDSISILSTVLTSQGCHTKYQELDGLKQQKFIISVLETRILKSRCQQAQRCSLDALGENSSLAFSQLRVFFGLQMHHSNSVFIGSVFTLFSICMCLSLGPNFYLLLEQKSCWVRAHHNDLILILLLL